MNPSVPCCPDSQWRASPFLHLRRWDDEFIAYHSLSGDTHLLGLAAGQLLSALQPSPASLSSLSQLPGLNIETSANLLVAELETLSLIERTPS